MLFSFQPPSASSKTLLDHDGDTRGDLVLAQNKGNNKFTLTSLSSLKRFNPMEISTFKSPTFNYQNCRFLSGNFDSDALSDYAIIYRYSKSATGIFILRSQNNFKPKRVFYSTSFSPDRSTFLAANFDNDNLTDFVAVYDHGKSQIGVFLFPSKKNYRVKRVYLGAKGGWNFKRSIFLTGDFNGDKIDELGAAYSYFDNTLGIFIFHPNYSYRPVKQYRSTSKTWEFSRTRFLVGDFDGNGSDEIAALQKNKKTTLYLLSRQNKYAPRLIAEINLSNLSSSSSYTVNDLNLDGKDEISACLKNKQGFYNFYTFAYPKFKPVLLKTASFGTSPNLLSAFSEASPLSKNRYDFSQPKKISLSNLKPGDISLIIIKGARALSGQKISIYGNDGKLIDSSPCSTGRHFATPVGTFSIIYKREVLVSRNFRVYCIKPVYFKKGYAIHGWPRSQYTHQSVSYYLLGRPASRGCVRVPEYFAIAIWKGSKVSQTKVKILP